jgi:hypothetical protein
MRSLFKAEEWRAIRAHIALMRTQSAKKLETASEMSTVHKTQGELRALDQFENGNFEKTLIEALLEKEKRND